MDTLDFQNDDRLMIRPLDLPSVRPQAARRNRALSRARAPVPVLEDIAVSLVPDTRLDWMGAGKRVSIAFSASGEAGFVTTVVPVVQRLLARADLPVRPDALDAELAALAIETVLTEPVEALEGMLGRSIALHALDTVSDRPDLAQLCFEMRMDGDGPAYPGTIHAPAALLSVLARGWMDRPALDAPREDVRLPLSFRVAYTDLTLSALRSLRTGDAMLFDRIAMQGGAAAALGEAMHSSVRFDEEGNLHLAEPFAAPEPYGMGEFLMTDDDPEQAVRAVSDADLDDLPVRLVFEVGRTDMSVADLRALTVGAPLPLDRPASAAVQILANGRRIGAGEMVMIGEQLGVRITQLNGHG